VSGRGEEKTVRHFKKKERKKIRNKYIWIWGTPTPPGLEEKDNVLVYEVTAYT